MTHQIENLVHSDFMTNLGTDWLAIAPNGHVQARATTEAAVRQAAPDAAHYIDAKGLAGATAVDAEPEPNPVSAGLDAVVAQQAPAEDAKPDTDPDADDKAPVKAAPKKAAAKK